MFASLSTHCQSWCDALLRHPRRTLLCLIVLACGLVASTWHYFGVTWDEPEHVAAGMQLVDRGAYIYDIQHPPVARIAMALGPWLAGAHVYDEPGPSGEQSGRDLFYGTGHYDEYLELSRLGMLPFYVLLLISIWLWTRHVYGEAEALLATVLLIATPPLLGHAGVAALDMPGTATCTLALYCLLRWYETQGWKYALLAGLSGGLAMATKLSGLPFVAVVGLAWLPFWWWSRKPPANTAASTMLPRWLGQSATILAIALVFTVFTYSWKFRYTVSDQFPYNTAWSYLFGRSGWAHDAVHAVARVVPLPVGMERFAWSLEALLAHNQQGHLSYLLGHFSESGFREFYVVALLVRTPIALLVLGSAGLVYLGRAARNQGWTFAAPTIAFIALLLFCSFYSHINIGLRHVFVLYPLWCMAAATICVRLWRRAPTLSRPWLLRGLLVLLTGWQISLLASQYPDYLPYFNAFAGSHPEKILIDSDLDWGQDIRRLRHRLEELKIDKFAFVYRGTIDVIGEHLPGVWMAQPFQPTTGWVAASIFARDTVSKGEAFAWLRQYTPRERVGKSIDLYFIPEAAGSAPAVTNK